MPIANDVPADPPFQRVAIEYTDHERGAVQLAAAFPGLAPEQLPDGKGWAVEHVSISTTTARTWMRPGTTTRPWTAENAR